MINFAEKNKNPAKSNKKAIFKLRGVDKNKNSFSAKAITPALTGFGRKASYFPKLYVPRPPQIFTYFLATKKIRSDVSLGALSVKSAVISSTAKPASVSHC